MAWSFASFGLIGASLLKSGFGSGFTAKARLCPHETQDENFGPVYVRARDVIAPGQPRGQGEGGTFCMHWGARWAGDLDSLDFGGSGGKQRRR